jgi:hypothetical protein
MANAPLVRVYWHAPAPLFAARVNLASPTYPIQDIPFDGVTTGAYTDLRADMFFTLGSAAGLDDYGRGRLRQAPTSTTLKVGRSSQGYEDGQLNVVDNAYITVYEDYRVHAKIPVIGSDYAEYKDADISVDYRTEEPLPICNMGADFAGTVDASTGLLVVFFAGSASYAVADAATITGYAWDADGGTFVNGTSATDDDVYIEFGPGTYWVSLTVTDSNGHTNTGYRFVLADDPDGSLCVSGMQVQNITRTQQGSMARLRVLQDLPRADYPDGAKVIVWEDRSSLDGVSRDHVLFTGWHQTDQAGSRTLETHLQRETELTCVDIVGRLDSLPGFHQRVEVPTAEDLVDPGMNWGYMPAANMDKFLCYLVQWHSTAAQVADFYTSGTWADYPFVLFDSAGDTLYSQLQRQANRIVPDYDFMSDRYGMMRVVVNPQTQDPADRTIVIQNSLTDQSWSEIDFGYRRPPRVHTLRGSALQVQTAWEIDEDDEKQLLTPLFAIAPGTAPGQGGREQTIGERLAQSQEDLNATVGHHYARLNARYGPINVTLNSNADPWDFDPAAHTWVNLIISSANAPQRGLDFANVRCLCKEVGIDYTYSEEAVTWRGRVVLEVETQGLPALTEEAEPALPVGEQPVVPPAPGFGLESGTQQVAGIGTMGEVCRTSDFQDATPTWDVVYFTHGEAVDPELLQCFVVDPFSPGYIDTPGGAINGWAVNQDGIWRLTDLFGATPGAELQHAFATTDAMYQGTYAIAASFGAYFESGNPWIVVTAVVNRAGTTLNVDDGVWAIHSEDAGATWSSEIRISPVQAPGTTWQTRQRPTVWTSPRTPGRALAFAFTSPTFVEAYQSLDWGETWGVLLPESEETDGLPMWVHFNHTGGALVSSGPSLTKELTVGRAGTSGTDSGNDFLCIAPPTNAKRIKLFGEWVCTNVLNTGLASTAAGLTISSPGTGVDHTSDLAFTAPATSGSGATTSGGFQAEYTLTNPTTTNWPGTSVQIGTTSGDQATDFGAAIQINMSATTNATITLTLTLRIAEIELEDGTQYEYGSDLQLWSGEGFGGALHIPWQDNAGESVIYFGRLIPGTTDLFTLHRSDGVTVTDITPTDATGGYGPYRGLFAVRAHDSNRQRVLFGGETEGADGWHYYSVFVSDDAGDTWTQVQGPDREDEFSNYGGWEAAWAADDTDTFFIWGGSQRDQADGATSYGTVIGYSGDFGATIQDKTGNLITLEASDENLAGFIGIAGGPTA